MSLKVEKWPSDGFEMSRKKDDEDRDYFYDREKSAYKHRNRSQQDDYMASRREERIRIAKRGDSHCWGRSPVHRFVEEELNALEPGEARDWDNKDAVESEDDKEERKSKKKHKKEKKKKKKSKKKRKHSSSDSQDSAEEKWIEVTKDNLHEADRSDEEGMVGPQLPHEARAETSSRVDYGRNLLPGEGAAMAAFVADGKRIPRRGEIGLDSGDILDFEASGYVMSGARHHRMEATRLRKENQIYSAEEKRMLDSFGSEERKKKEQFMISQFKQLVNKKQKQS